MGLSRTVHVRVEGRVQGVSYRAWTEMVARALRLSGWVRNCADGSVEMVLQGSARDVAEMLCHCAEGPPAARVTHVEVNDDTSGPYASFEVKETT